MSFWSTSEAAPTGPERASLARWLGVAYREAGAQFVFSGYLAFMASQTDAPSGALTYMSREEILKRLLDVDRPQLFELTPIFSQDDETPRTMYVSADILAVVTPPFADTIEGERLGKFRAWLDDFIDGARVSISEDPRGKPPDTMLARVEEVEQEFWSIRVTEPADTAGIRSFGAFCALNEFVAVTWGLREDIGREFDDAVTDAQERWKDFFGEAAPNSGDNLDEYLTNYYRAF